MTTYSKASLLTLFLSYVDIDTRSVKAGPGEENRKLPSSEGQSKLIDKLRKELIELGVLNEQIVILGDGSLKAVLPATAGCEGAPHITLCAHVDTYPGQPGEVSAIVHQRYRSGGIVFSKEVSIPPCDLYGLEGQTIITSDGKSLLGGNDKAGLAEIMAALPSILAGPHGPLTVIFFTDEESGEAKFIQFLDPNEVADWDAFYTLDGLEAGTIDIGCFNAGNVTVTFKGTDAHPGVGGTNIKSALYAAAEFINQLNDNEPQPWEAGPDSDSGMIYATDCTGNAAEAIVHVIARSFDLDRLTETFFNNVIDLANFAAGAFGLEVEVSNMAVLYKSTENALNRQPHHIRVAESAVSASGLKVTKRRVRGGTDGAMLIETYPDLPCVNLGTGDRNCHQLNEFVVLEEMMKMVQAIINLVLEYSKLLKTPKKNDA